MWVFGVLLIVISILIVLFFVVTTKELIKFFNQYFTKESLSITLSLLVIALLIALIFLSPSNVIVFYIHLFAFIAITRLICFFINKNKEKKINSLETLIIGTIITIVYMIIGVICFYNVKRTDYNINTLKNISGDFNIIQIADAHLGYTMSAQRFNKYIEEINELNSDVVVITGDLIDDNTPYEDMVEGAKGLGNLKTKYGVYFVYGNHDKGYYNRRNYTDKELREELKKNNIIILEDDYIELDNNVVIVGRQDSQVLNRKDMQELVKDIDVNNKYVVVLDHEPTDYDNEEKAKVDLVLSGHTHGGQVIPLGILGEILGPNDKTYGIEKRGDTSFIVSSGISDYGMTIKTGAISEYNYIKISK